MSNLALAIKQLSKTYANGQQALKNVDLIVNEGDFFALLGPNGAGKSTLLGIVSSLVNKSSGQVEIFNIDIDHNFSRAKFELGVVPQEFNFNPFEKVIDIVLFEAGYYGLTRRQAYPRAQQLLEDLGLYSKRHTQARMLSGGMKRRLMIARALIHQPRLLILDEPTAGVDIELRRSMWEYMQRINAAGTTIILTTHYLEEAENLCRNIAIINHGEIIQNSSMRDLLAKLDSERFVLDLAQPIQHLELTNLTFEILDPKQILLTVGHGQSLNEIFAQLSAQQIEVVSLRNQTNRLETLFVNLTKDQTHQTHQGIR